MAKLTKSELIAKGKEIGLNLNSKMSEYELTHRIEEREKELEKKGSKAETKKSASKASGEY